MSLVLSDSQVNRMGELRSLDMPHPGMPVLRYLTGKRRDMPIEAPPNAVFIENDTGRMWIYCHPVWNTGTLAMRPKRMKWAGIPYAAVDVGRVYIWV